MGDQLSGGEQWMLAIGRALMTNPKLSILVIDKNLAALLEIADRHYIMEKGRVVWSGDSASLASDHELTRRYLGV